MAFDLQKAKELRVRIDILRGQTIQCSEFDIVLASSWLPAAIDRIDELEKALVEERARALWLVGDDPANPENLDWKVAPNDIPKSVRLQWVVPAKTQLQKEGLI
jgi:hypothetical protein